LFARAPLPDRWNFAALATDGSSTSLRAVRHGLRIATALGATPRLVTAARTEAAGAELLEAAALELGLDLPEREVLVDQHPASAVANAGWKYELVVIGNRGMSGPGRLLGSVANKITHELRTNLLLVNTTRS
jgi:nucleotide-binding universal stress UspA family protein